MGEWERVKLDEVCREITVGHVGPMAEKYVDEGIPFLRSLSVAPFRITRDGLKFIDAEFHAKLKKSALRPGDVVIVRTGKPGTCAVIPEWLKDANCSDLVIARCGPRMRPRFLCYVINSVAGQHIDNHLVGAVQQHFNVGSARTLEFGLPDLAEQDEILALLGSIDDKIELNRRMNETLEAMARAIFRDWFVDFGPTRAKAEGRPPYLAPEIWDLFPDALDDDDKPVGWAARQASDLFEFNPRETIRKGASAPYLDMAALPTIGPIPAAPKSRDYNSGTKFKDGDTLFARITPCLENGKTAYAFGLGDGVVAAGSTEFIVIRSKAPVPAPVSYLLARDPEFRRHAERSMTGTSGRQRANAEALMQYELGSPSDDSAWLALGDLIEPMMDRVIANAHESRSLAQTRDLLLPKLMSGEIRLPEAREMIGEVA